MIRYDILIYAGIIVLALLAFLITGYWLGRKTVTDVPLIERKFNPKDDKKPEQDEITRCLHGDGVEESRH